MPEGNTSLSAQIKWVIRRSNFYCVIEYARHRIEIIRWIASKKRGPAPHLIKQAVIRDYALRHHLRTLIETGTFLGTMINAMKRRFDRIVSVELDAKLCEAARRRFSRHPHISILRGDSATILPEVLRSVHEPCLFWLDGHYSGGITAKAGSETPVMEELRVVLSHPVDGHVILIDDARDFTGRRGYPTLNEIERFVGGFQHGWHVEVRDDIMRIYARQADRSVDIVPGAKAIELT